MPTAPRVIVVGAGIVGASLAWHLAAGGADVTVLESGDRGGVATPRSWAWINASWGNPEPYVALRLQAIDDWHRLQRALPGLPVTWSGGLLWDLPRSGLEAYVRQHRGWGYDLRLVEREEIGRLEPALADPPALAVHAPGEGAVDPLAAALMLLQAAEDLGARVETGGTVSALVAAGGRVTGVQVGGARLPADAVVVAAGAGSPALCATVGCDMPVVPSPGLLVSTRPVAPLLNGLVMAPEVHVRQLADGRLLAGADFGGGDPGADQAVEAAAVMDALRRLLTPAEGLELDGWAVGLRPMPADELPILGRPAGLSGLTIAAMHSGITLAPAVGRLLAAEILQGEISPLLAPFRPDRFAA